MNSSNNKNNINNSNKINGFSEAELKLAGRFLSLTLNEYHVPKELTLENNAENREIVLSMLRKEQPNVSEADLNIIKNEIVVRGWAIISYIANRAIECSAQISL